MNFLFSTILNAVIVVLYKCYTVNPNMTKT